MSKIEDLFDRLKKDGVTDEELALLITELAKASALKLFTQGMLMIPDERKKEIEELDDDEAIQKLLANSYQEVTGTSPEESVDELLDKFSEDFLKNYKKA